MQRQIGHENNDMPSFSDASLSTTYTDEEANNNPAAMTEMTNNNAKNNNVTSCTGSTRTLSESQRYISDMQQFTRDQRFYCDTKSYSDNLTGCCVNPRSCNKLACENTALQSNNQNDIAALNVSQELVGHHGDTKFEQQQEQSQDENYNQQVKQRLHRNHDGGQIPCCEQEHEIVYPHTTTSKLLNENDVEVDKHCKSSLLEFNASDQSFVLSRVSSTAALSSDVVSIEQIQFGDVETNSQQQISSEQHTETNIQRTPSVRFDDRAVVLWEREDMVEPAAESRAESLDEKLDRARRINHWALCKRVLCPILKQKHYACQKWCSTLSPQELAALKPPEVESSDLNNRSGNTEYYDDGSTEDDDDDDDDDDDCSVNIDNIRDNSKIGHGYCEEEFDDDCIFFSYDGDNVSACHCEGKDHAKNTHFFSKTCDGELTMSREDVQPNDVEHHSNKGDEMCSKTADKLREDWQLLRREWLQHPEDDSSDNECQDDDDYDDDDSDWE